MSKALINFYSALLFAQWLGSKGRCVLVSVHYSFGASLYVVFFFVPGAPGLRELKKKKQLTYISTFWPQPWWHGSASLCRDPAPLPSPPDRSSLHPAASQEPVWKVKTHQTSIKRTTFACAAVYLLLNFFAAMSGGFVQHVPVPWKLPAGVLGQFVLRHPWQHRRPAGGESGGTNQHHSRVDGGARVHRHLRKRRLTLIPS